MSFYATIAGTIKYDKQADFEVAVGILKDDGWLDDDDFLVNELGARITVHKSIIDRTKRIIRFPKAHYRNLAPVLGDLFRGGSGRIVWTSTDGCFTGGVIVDGAETVYDLGDWDAAEGGDSAPDPDEQFDEYVEWQAEVEEAFFDQFSPDPA